LRLGPLSPETQQFFLMLGIPVLQGYGLTETTGICTLDDPRLPVERVTSARRFGNCMKISENEEMLCVAPTFFRDTGTARKRRRACCKTLFYTGDQGGSKRGGMAHQRPHQEPDYSEFRATTSPRNQSREKLRSFFQRRNSRGGGNGRGYLVRWSPAASSAPAVQAALDAVNPELPHYRQIRNFTVIFPKASPIEERPAHRERQTSPLRHQCALCFGITAMYDAKGVRESSQRETRMKVLPARPALGVARRR